MTTCKEPICILCDERQCWNNVSSGCIAGLIENNEKEAKKSCCRK